MNKPVKTKLCWNCEGSVSRTAENCPFCAVYLSPEAHEDEEVVEAAKSQAPYFPGMGSKSSSVPKAPYQPASTLQEPLAEPQSIPEPKANGVASIFVPLISLTGGLFALLFAVLLLLFSTNGVLTLEWDAEFWYIYGLAAIPLLLVGWKFLD